MIGKIRNLDRTDGGFRLTLDVLGRFDGLERLKDIWCDVVLKKHREKRSIDANRLCWELCTQIGNAIQPPLEKEIIYRHAIRSVGVFEDIDIAEEAVERFGEEWSAHGTGWLTEVVDDSPTEGHKLLRVYYGSSRYDTKEMSILIDWLVDQAQQMGLEIAYSLNEIDQIKRAWGLE